MNNSLITSINDIMEKNVWLRNWAAREFQKDIIMRRKNKENYFSSERREGEWKHDRV